MDDGPHVGVDLLGSIFLVGPKMKANLSLIQEPMMNYINFNLR